MKQCLDKRTDESLCGEEVNLAMNHDQWMIFVTFLTAQKMI